MRPTLENQFLAVAFDERGCLASLRCQTTGRELLTGQPLDFWRLVLAGGDQPAVSIHARQQSPGEFTHAANELTVRYPRVTDAHGRVLDLAFGFQAKLAADELQFRAWIDNQAAPEIRELWFPMIGGLGRADADGARSFLLYPESAGRRITDPVRNLADRHAQPVRGDPLVSLRDLYPGRASMQWLGLYAPAGNVYVGSHDHTLQSTATNAMLQVGPTPADDTLSLGFIKYPFAAAGTRWESAPFVVAVHAGHWQQDAARYRRFVDTYQDHRRGRAPWVQDMPALHDIILLHQHGGINYRYDQLPAIAHAAAQGKIDVLKLTGWADGGHDNHYPDFLPSDRLGGEPALRAAFRHVQTAGFKVVQYFHFVQMSRNSEFYRRWGEFCSLKSPGGNQFIDIFTWPGEGSLAGLNERVPLVNACVDTAPWRDQVLDCVRRGLDYGADAVFLDQTAGAPSSYLCFDKRHGHSSPAFACGPGKVGLSRVARDLVKAAGPERALGAEYIADVILQYYDFTIPFGHGLRFGGQHFGEMYRQTFPEDVICSQYLSREDYDQLHYSFVMGYRFFLAPGQQCDLLSSLDQRFVDRVACLTDLWRRHTDPLLRGQFRGDEPLTVDEPRLVARAYESDAAAAVAVWNPGPSTVPLALDWPGKRLTDVEIAGHGRGADTGSVSLAANDIAVLTFQPTNQ